MINPILNKDDTFVRISKYGHVFGIVKSIGSKTIQSIDLKSLETPVYSYHTDIQPNPEITKNHLITAINIS